MHNMMTSSNGTFSRVTGPLCGEFTGHRWIPRTKTSDAELWCFLGAAPWIYDWLKQSRGWWSGMPSRSLWRHCNEALRGIEVKFCFSRTFVQFQAHTGHRISSLTPISWYPDDYYSLISHRAMKFKATRVNQRSMGRSQLSNLPANDLSPVRCQVVA